MHYFSNLFDKVVRTDHASRRQQNYNDKYLLLVYSVEIFLMKEGGHVRNI
jgi:hypothetical protein